jgi:hypothetical protein
MASWLVLAIFLRLVGLAISLANCFQFGSLPQKSDSMKMENPKFNCHEKKQIFRCADRAHIAELRPWS